MFNGHTHTHTTRQQKGCIYSAIRSDFVAQTDTITRTTWLLNAHTKKNVRNVEKKIKPTRLDNIPLAFHLKGLVRATHTLVHRSARNTCPLITLLPFTLRLLSATLVVQINIIHTHTHTHTGTYSRYCHNDAGGLRCRSPFSFRVSRVPCAR